jgi:putative membrane protein
MNLIIRIGVSALSLMIVSYVVPGIAVANIYTALLAAVVLGLLHLIVRPLLILLTLPVTFLTLGLFIFVINGFLFWSVSMFVSGFVIQGFLPALVGSIVVTIISTIGNKLLT